MRASLRASIAFYCDMTVQDFFWGVIGLAVVTGLVQIIRACMRHTRRIDGVIQDLEERAHTCKDEEVENVLIEAIGYGHTGMTMRQQLRLISTMHFLMGRKKSVDAKKNT